MTPIRPKDQPEPPFPAQDISPLGIEEEISPKPRFEADQYRGSDKLRDCVAIITSGDSSIGRAVAVLFAREGVDVAIVHLPEREDDGHAAGSGSSIRYSSMRRTRSPN